MVCIQPQKTQNCCPPGPVRRAGSARPGRQRAATVTAGNAGRAPCHGAARSTGTGPAARLLTAAAAPRLITVSGPGHAGFEAARTGI
jgi:hypothetical protein